ncbi:MAG: 4-(cytidine 5'-diphospho)-2-C-methyl-D-erythritol kinase [Ectothiorhodospiraceae bacterium]|nr:4-(cytidine 5'-diphospho)-2-C-methyl-D-erythritol kinase [Ectothiorhodospiraceae bacterium]
MVELRAYAKINIGLQIVRKRDDGFHDIDTVFHRVDVYDTIKLTPAESGVTIKCDTPTIPTDDTNLCARAAKALLDATGSTKGVHILLEKRIPVGAGLGGGSSDAASVLTGLTELLHLTISPDELAQIAEKIGSDVPYFLRDGSAYAKGKGEILSYFELDLPYWIVLVYPGIHISTPWAYGRFEFNPQLPIHNLQKLLLEHKALPVRWVNSIRNDFEPIVFEAHEEIMRVKEVLYRTGADFALMSGSGSSVFGLFRDERYANECADFFSKRYPTYITQPGWNPA